VSVCAPKKTQLILLFFQHASSLSRGRRIKSVMSSLSNGTENTSRSLLSYYSVLKDTFVMPFLLLKYVEESSPSYVLERLRWRPSALASRTSTVAASWLYTACQVHESLTHRVDRVPGFLSSRPNRPPTSPARECCSSPLWVQGGRHIRLRELGWGNPIPTKGQTLWYSMYTTVSQIN
jgi:hypothetical protein